MIVDTRSDEHVAQPDPVEARHCFLDELRRQFSRHDLDDATLEEAVADAAARLGGARRQALLERVFAGQADQSLRRALVASLCLPAPRAPMAMPMQTLERARERASLLPRLAGLRALARRRRIGER
jgi:hypothetical protein